jgi:hypothetical protein
MQQQDKTPATPSLPAIGAPFEGGYFAGVITNGEQRFALVCAGIAGELKGYWHKAAELIDGAMSAHDGKQNTLDMLAAGLRLAEEATALTINGFNDWYIPSRDELETAYRAFKPTTDRNWCLKDGNNAHSVPRGEEYTPELPAQTSVEAFREGGPDAFASTWYWTSTQHRTYSHYAWHQHFDDGDQDLSHKSYAGRVRVFRRLPI